MEQADLLKEETFGIHSSGANPKTEGLPWNPEQLKACNPDGNKETGQSQEQVPSTEEGVGVSVVGQAATPRAAQGAGRQGSSTEDEQRNWKIWCKIQISQAPHSHTSQGIWIHSTQEKSTPCHTTMTIPLPQEKLLSLLTNASVFRKASRGMQDTRCRIMGQPPSPSVFLALFAGKQQKTCPNKPK